MIDNRPGEANTLEEWRDALLGEDERLALLALVDEVSVDLTDWESLGDGEMVAFWQRFFALRDVVDRVCRQMDMGELALRATEANQQQEIRALRERGEVLTEALFALTRELYHRSHLSDDEVWETLHDCFGVERA